MSKKHNVAFTDSDIVIRAVEPEIPESHVSLPTVEGYTFETVEIPKRNVRKGSLTYPIDQLIAGSPVSFLVPATPDKVKQVIASIRQFAYRHDFTVTLRAEANGIRVWRAEPKPETTTVA